MALKSNKNLVIAGSIGVLALLAMVFASGKSNAGNVPASNPDPVNHPNAVLVKGVWRDTTHYYNPNTMTWVAISGSTTVTGAFDLVFPETDGFQVISYMKIMLRITSNYDAFEAGDKITIKHANYNKTTTITRKFTGEDGNKYIVANTMWNFLALGNIITGPYSIPINTASGTITKTA